METCISSSVQATESCIPPHPRGLGGAIGGMLAAKAVGVLLDLYKIDGHIQAGYNLIFILCGLSYVLAFAAFQGLSPELKKVSL